MLQFNKGDKHTNGNIYSLLEARQKSKGPKPQREWVLN